MSALADPSFWGLASGFGLIGYGLSPLAGTTIQDGLSERGCLVALGGIVVVCAVTILMAIS